GRKIINRLDEKRKEINQELVDKKAANDNECKRIQSMITDAIDPHLVAYKELDDKEKQRKIDLENALDERIQTFRNCIVLSNDMDCDSLSEMIHDVESDPCEHFYHRSAEALKVRNEVVEHLKSIWQNMRKAEELQRLDAERIRKEESERKAENDRLEAQRLEQAEQQRILDEKQAKIDAEAAERQGEIDERERKIKAKEDALRAKQEAQEREEREARIAMEAKEEAAREALEKAQREQEAEQARIADETAEKARIASQAPDKVKLAAFGSDILAVIDCAPEIKDKEISKRLDGVILMLKDAAGMTL
ncbi:MAG: hypothetical protein V3W52_17370, partial [Syntrophobacteria bacterium]